MRRFQRLMLIGAFATVAFALMAEPAQAQSGCSASANGADVRQFGSPSSAMDVRYDGTISISAAAPGPGAYRVDLEVAGRRWKASSGTFDESSWSDSVAVADYSDHSGGLHKVVATSTNQEGTCRVVAYVNVTGKGPLGTTAGKVATAAVAVGVVGTAVGAANGGRKDLSEENVGKTAIDWLGGPESDVLDAPKQPEMSTDEATRNVERFATPEDPIMRMALCSSAIVMAVGLTMKAMAAEAAHAVVAMVGRTFR